MASPSSALATTNYSYNIFCSFHEPDIRNILLSHILKQFRNEITMFIDSEIERRAEIVPEAIRNSRISIVILSRRYASSKMCLDELVEILESRKTMGQIVMTLFYGVAPADVRCQCHEFGDIFRKHVEGNTDEDIQKWRNALKDVSSIAGVDALYRLVRVDGADMIEKFKTAALVQHIATLSRDFDAMVGLEAHLKEIQFLLDLDSDEVKIFAITGPVGIGKSTIARALHALLSHRFQLHYFGSSHSDFDEYDLKLHLQEQSLLKILNESGISHLRGIKENLNDKRVLIILDDVNNLRQLEALANVSSWSGRGSRIIVITEDHKLLEQHGICNTYNVKFPSHEDAIKMLCTYAFKQTSPLYGFDNLAKSVTEVCGKRPLDLRIVGFKLRGKSKDEWEDVVKRQKSRKVESKLRRQKMSGNSAGENLSSWLAPKNNVYCSYYEEDVHKTDLMSHIHYTFKSNAITIKFSDDTKIERRAEIVPEAIRNSSISIVILSKGYASSKTCLDELVEILESSKAMGQVVMPLFYGVSSSDVRHQSGEFGHIFHNFVSRYTDENIQKWEKALKEVGNIPGEDSLYWVSEEDMIEKIANDVLYELNASQSIYYDDLETKPLLDSDNDEVKMDEISGPSGIDPSDVRIDIPSSLDESVLISSPTEEDYFSCGDGGGDDGDSDDKYGGDGDDKNGGDGGGDGGGDDGNGGDGGGDDGNGGGGDDGVDGQPPPILEPSASRKKVIIEWTLLIIFFISEIPSCVLDQISSTNKPSYALVAMLLSLFACLTGLIDILYKGITDKVVWKSTWAPIPGFYYPTDTSNPTEIAIMFGTFPEMVGLICSVCQSILTTINYSFIIRKVDAPIKVSVWPLIFALGALFNLYAKGYNRRI